MSPVGTVPWSVPRDLAIGSTLSPLIGVPMSVGYAIDCTPDTNQDRTVTLTFTVSTAPVTGYTDVYATDVAGVGIRYNFRGVGCGSVLNGPVTHIEKSIWILTCSLPKGTAAIQIYGTGTSAEFVKTGPITAGLLKVIPAVRVSYRLDGQTTPSTSLDNVYAGTATATFVVQTCMTPNLTIQLGAVPSSTFAGAGIKTSNWVNRNIRINSCPPNLNQVSIRFNTPLSGWLDEANKVFKLDNATDAATAQGIGIQMSFGNNTNDTIAPYDTFQVLSDYDRIKDKGGSFSVPVGGRYYKPASSTSVRPGTANGTVIFDMLYQ